MVDQDFIEDSIIEVLKTEFDENHAAIFSFPDQPQYEEGILKWIAKHPVCEILVIADNIGYTEDGLAQQDVFMKVEITVFAPRRTGDNGARSVCRKIRQALTSNLIDGCQLIPTDESILFYDGSVWCYGQQYKYDSIYVMGE